MPTHLLQKGVSTHLPHQAITIRALTVPRDDALVLQAVDDHGRLLTPPQVRTPVPDLLILPRVTGRVRIRASRHDGRPFATGTSLAMSIAVEIATDPDPLSATVKTEVSGLESPDVVALERVPHGVKVSLLQEASERPLTGLGGDAAGAARVLIGAQHTKGEDSRDMAVLVDASASMSPWAEDGSLGAVLSVLAGVDHICGGTAGLEVRLSDASSAWTKAEPGDVGTVVAAQLAALQPRSGFRTAPHRPDPGKRWVVLTDSVPLDWRGESTLVVLARGTGAERLVRETRPEIVVVRVPDGMSAADHLSDAQPLHDVVRACLTAFGVELNPRRPS